jgi:hypothetical protein
MAPFGRRAPGGCPVLVSEGTSGRALSDIRKRPSAGDAWKVNSDRAGLVSGNPPLCLMLELGFSGPGDFVAIGRKHLARRDPVHARHSTDGGVVTPGLP